MFLAKPWTKESVGETECCAARRCKEHIEEKYVCACAVQVARKIEMLEEHGRPDEVRLEQKEVVTMTCEMPKYPPNAKCADCRLGFFLCIEHMGICGKFAAMACSYCSRPR